MRYAKRNLLELGVLEDRIAKKHGVSVEALFDNLYRDKHVSRARWELWRDAMRSLDFSYYALAKRYGFNHTSIMQGVRKLQ